jgi:hypothetical protein
MPTPRRLRLSILLSVIAIIFLLYFYTAADQTRSSDFYTRTSSALAQREAEEKDGRALESDDAAVQRSLREAAEQAKKAADVKGVEFHGQEVKKAAEKANVAEDLKEDVQNAKKVEIKELENKDVVMSQEKVLESESEKEGPEREEDIKAKETFDSILKKSPSKSFLSSWEEMLIGSHHIFKDLLSIFEEGKAYPVGSV